MLKSFVKCTLAAAIAAAFAGAAFAQAYVTAGGTPVRSADGSCWRTASWTPESASEECDPQFITKASLLESEPGVQPTRPAVVKRVPVSYKTEVLFAFNDDRIGGEALKRLDELTQKLVAMEVETITAVGHADVIGSSHYNQLLSARRVWAVRDHLAAKGIKLELVHLEAKGDREPIAWKACEFMGVEKESKAGLIACLQPDRRVQVEVTGHIEETH